MPCAALLSRQNCLEVGLLDLFNSLSSCMSDATVRTHQAALEGAASVSRSSSVDAHQQLGCAPDEGASARAQPWLRPRARPRSPPCTSGRPQTSSRRACCCPRSASAATWGCSPAHGSIVNMAAKQLTALLAVRCASLLRQERNRTSKVCGMAQDSTQSVVGRQLSAHTRVCLLQHCGV